MAKFIDNVGATQDFNLDATIYRQAADEGLSVEAYINQKCPTQADAPSAFEQMCASEGMFIGRNDKFGIRPATMDAILNGRQSLQAGVITKDAVPASRILFPMFQMAAMEDKLRNSDYGILSLFNGAAAVVDTINNDRFERPFLNYSKPEAARSKAISQLSEPASMLTITVSDKSYRVTGTSIGLEISDQALQSTSLDLVTMAMTRQAETEMQEKVEGYMLNFLNGDVDLDMVALSSVSGAVTTAASFDTAATSGITQKSWVKWLFNNSRKRKITHVICDLDSALAIEARAGRPNVQGDNATSKRIDTLENIINPMWPDQVQVLITMDPNFPANTILGFDASYGYHVVNSTVLNYSAAEAYAMRRSTKYRVDTGMIAYRLFDEAWSVLTYA
jgi:hypothetical protein